MSGAESALVGLNKRGGVPPSCALATGLLSNFPVVHRAPAFPGGPAASRLRRSSSGKGKDRREHTERQACDERILGGGAFVESLWREDALRGRLPPLLGLEELVGRVARAYGVEADEIRRRRKLPSLSEARSVVCYLAVRELGCKGPEVGRTLALGRAGLSGAVQRGERVVRARPDLLKLAERHS